MPRQQSSAAHVYAQESEWETFCRLITHDDRNSYYVVSSFADGTWTDTAVKKDSLPALGFNPRASFYMTHNGFTSCCRKADQVRQLNALFFDLDCHNQSASQTQATVRKTLLALSQAIKESKLPQPTMTINSGRGVQLFFVLERSVPYRFENGSVNEKALRLFNLVQTGLADILEHIVSPIEGIEVDRATFDFSRVSRIPGTFNAKAGRYASLEQHTEVFHGLSGLLSFIMQRKHLQLKALPQRTSFTHSGNIMRYQPMLMSRLGKLIELQKYRNFDCTGTRELMSFVFYNTAVQIYSRDDAKTRLQSFNSRFNSPLSSKELAGVISSVDKVTNVRGEKGYYLISAQRLTELLALTPQELVALNFFESKRTAERKEQKRLTAERKQARNSQIIALKQQGCTQKEIANAVGCSVRTIASVLKAAGQTITRTNHRERNIILVNRYNKKHLILCNFLSYESLKCPLSASFSVGRARTFKRYWPSSRYLRLLRCSSMTKTPCSLIFVSFQGVLYRCFLIRCLVLLSYGLFRFGRLLQ